MIDISRVAFVACGSLRDFSNCYNTWNIFKNQHNYVFTWDTDYIKGQNESTVYIPSIPKLEDLIEAKKQKIVMDYVVFKEPLALTPAGESPKKSPYLWSVLNNYISYDYDYIFITRPDLWLEKMNDIHIQENYKLPMDNEIQTIHVVHEGHVSVSDHMFFMKRVTCKKFSKVFSYFGENPVGSIHGNLYKFFKEEDLLVTNTLKHYVDGFYYRTPAKINENSKIQIVEEMIRNRDVFGSDRGLTNAILIVSRNFLSSDDKKTHFYSAMQRYNQLHGFINSEWRCFESSTIELGMEKIKEYEKEYQFKFTDIEVVNI